MTKKAKDNKTGKDKSANNKTFSFFKDEKFKISLGVFLFVFSFILCLSFISYLFTWHYDQNILDLKIFNILSSDPSIEVKNWIGKIGAVISHFFIHELFGLASFSFIFLSFFFGLYLFDVKLAKPGKTLFLSILFTIWFSLFLASVFYKKYFYLGGAHGYYLFDWLKLVIGLAGAYIFIFFSGFIIFVYSFKNSLNFIKSIFKRKQIKDIPLEISNDKSTSFDNDDDDIIYNKPNDKEDDFDDNEVFDNTNNNTEIEKISENSKIIEFDNGANQNKLSIQKFEEKKSTLDNIEFEINQNSEEEVPEEEINTEFFEDYDPTKDLEYYKIPPIELLEDHRSNKSEVSPEELEENKNKIVKTLLDYKIDIEKIRAIVGPTVTLYKIKPAAGIRISKIKSLEDDIALSLAALGIRIIAPVPGESVIGIEVPNSKPEIVSMRSVVKSKKFQDSTYSLPVALGKTIEDETYVFDLSKTPHLLVAGATGQGKSVGVNAIITSLLYKKHPSQLKFVMVDPKMVELSIYNKIEKHYLAKLPNEESAIITDVSKVVPTMNSLCVEMDIRYKLLTQANVRNILEYNSKFIKRKLNPEKGHYFMPYIVVVIDEFADIIVQEGKQIEAPVSRLAAKARAIGIHLIVATQRPSIDVITGVIKANFPSRIAFKVTNGHDSKTILDQTGANQLIGRGDMLISDKGEITRVQCAFIDTPEVEQLVDYISQQQSYASALELPEPPSAEGSSGGVDIDPNEKDEMFEEAARIVVRHQQGSTSLIQRKMSIGYNRAGRIIDQLEAAGVVGPYEGSKARQVFYPDEYSLEQYLLSIKNK